MNTSLRSYFSRKGNTAVCYAFLTVLYYGQFVTTINFIYRYIGVLWERPLSGRQYFGMLASLMAIVTSVFFWGYILGTPTVETEFLMTDEFMMLFGGPNATNKSEFRTCIRGDFVPTLIN
jgi:hypothetical protein